MVSNQVLQNTIEGIKEISHLELGIMDSDGREVAVTAPVFANAASAIPDFANSPADSQSAGPYQFFKVMDEQQLEYVIVVYGETDSSLLIGRMAAFQLKGLAEYVAKLELSHGRFASDVLAPAHHALRQLDTIDLHPESEALADVLAQLQRAAHAVSDELTLKFFSHAASRSVLSLVA